MLASTFTSALPNRRFLQFHFLSLLLHFRLVTEKVREKKLTLAILNLVHSKLSLAWCRDRSVSGHSVTTRETLSACSVEISGATAFEVTGISVLTFL